MRNALFALTLTVAFAAGQPEFLGQVWSLLTSVWSDVGCGMDPDGLCTPAPQTDVGCGMDPNGCPKGS